MTNELRVTRMLPLVPNERNEAYALACGFRWLSFLGRPCCGHPQYEQCRAGLRIRVRQFFSPQQLRNVEWILWLVRHRAAPAQGTEPLASVYDSSGSRVAPYPEAPGSWWVLEEAPVPGVWIPCARMLPDHGQRVLVYCPWRNGRAAAAEDDEDEVAVAYYWDDEGWWLQSHGVPTHWMPIPPSPEF